MKALKIFGWICFGLSLICLICSHALEYITMEYVGLNWSYFYDEYSLRWTVVSLVFFLAAILSWLVSRALKEIKNDLELKILMNS